MANSPVVRDAASAAAQGDITMLQRLVSQGADVNKKSKDGMTPLSIASFWGYTDIVELLLNNGSDLNAENSSTLWTPLHCAAFQGHGPVIMRLMSRRPDLAKKDMRGRTAADFASALDSIWPFFAAAGCRRTPKEDLIKMDIVYKVASSAAAPHESMAHFSRPGSSYAVRGQPPAVQSTRAFGGDVLAEAPEDDVATANGSSSNQKTASSSMRMWRH